MASLDRVEEKLDKVAERIGSIETTLAVQAQSLAHHVKRTDLLEARVEQFQEAKLQLTGAQKAAIAAGGLVSVALTAVEIYRLLRGA